MHLFFWFIIYLLKGFFHLFYKCKIEGKDHPYKGSAIIAPNHTSFLDPPIIGMAWPEETHYLARESLFHPFYMGWLLRKLNSHPVQGSAQDIQSFKTICKLLETGKKVVIFPEGERSYDGELLDIKGGIATLALRMKCPIIPTYIHGAYEAWPRTSNRPKLGSALICLFGDPIPIEPYLEMNKKQAQEALRKEVQKRIELLKSKVMSGDI